MNRILPVFILLSALAVSGCAAPKLHLRCRDMQTGAVAETSDQYAIRNALDLASRLKSWDKAKPMGADHLFTVHVRKHEESRPYLEMQVYHKHTRVTMLNNPDDSADDESINLKTSSSLKFALSDIGEYRVIKPEASNVERPTSNVKN